MELSYAPFTPFMNERMPGMAPLTHADWLVRDEAFARQMAYRDKLVEERPDIVLAGEGCEGAAELLNFVCETLAAHDDAYEVRTDAVTRPDGVNVPRDSARPFATLARLVQEDLLILRKPHEGGEHVLIGAALLFPSRWSLQEKMNRPLMGIHERVPEYDDRLGSRVQRLFDVLKPGRQLWRANWLVHPTSELHQPKLYTTAKKEHEQTGRFWLRVERQSILQLPISGCSVFSVKTVVTPIEALNTDQREGLITALEGQGAEMRDYHGGIEHNDAAVAALRAL